MITQFIGLHEDLVTEKTPVWLKKPISFSGK